MESAEKAFGPVLAVLAAVVLWGSSFPMMKAVLAVFGPWTIMWLRMLVGTLVLLPFLGRMSLAGYRKGDWRLLGGMVLCMPCLYFYLESNALTLTTSSQAGVVAAILPLVVALGGWMFLREPLDRGSLFGLALALCGVIVLTLSGSPDESAPHPVLGNLMELGAMLSAAVYMLLARQLGERYNALTLTGMQTLAGLVFFLPGAMDLGPKALEHPEALTAAAYLGAFVSIGAFGLYNFGLSRLQAGRAAVAINLVPVVAVALAWIWLGEALNPVQMLAAGATLLGVWLAQRGSSTQQNEGQQASLLDRTQESVPAAADPVPGDAS
ncbi:Threonine/homoserine efflux transporter RhtA [Paucidesulfovibrio gracilis DSM 16080]|uniref:Threonine/homoserine efflux transporter RhtA n=1 Tax=Paucidesulfovibrio gracilis DSM 16080 TaxID=1121449 RepID=A0A1T4WHC2_9BACT|nr:DMT family transporter [Paucidesulfovibrio gracilis]SKA76723.1 Threonine/homoserine efflux transporter RhtA [Paucidesulfovibrio gracilis DSM 16080]